MTSVNTAFLNVDLDLRVQSGLEELLNALDAFVIILNRTMHDASLELNNESKSLEETVVSFVEAIKSLPAGAMAIWNQCELRRFNIGIQAGIEPHQAVFTLSGNTVSLLASVQGEIAFTVYAPRN